jgi:hypothetical protein
MFKQYREDLKFSSKIVYYLFRIPVAILLSQKILLIPLIFATIVLFVGLYYLGEFAFSGPATVLYPLVTLGIMIILMILLPLFLFLITVLYVTLYSFLIGMKNFLIVLGEKKKIYLKPLKLAAPILTILLVLSILITAILKYKHIF